MKPVLLGYGVNSLDEAILDNLIDSALDSVEVHPNGLFGRSWEIQKSSVEEPVEVSAPYHEFPQENAQALDAIRIVRGTEIFLEYLEAPGVCCET